MSHTASTVTVTINRVRDEQNSLGAFNRSYRWQLPDTATGYLVQRVERREQVFGATATESDQNRVYWEAWHVVSGDVRGYSLTGELSLGETAAHDSWINNVTKGRPGKHGSWKMTGTLYWLADDAPEIKGFTYHGVPWAGELLSTAKDPGITSAPIRTHDYEGTWDARTADAVSELLHAQEANDNAPRSEEDAVEHMTDLGFSKELATSGVQLYIQTDGTFDTTDYSEEQADDDSKEKESVSTDD
jgi:hypothetical protein